MNDVNSSKDMNGSEIAIVGLSGRFPGAVNLDAFWQNLQNGVESVSFFSNEELLAAGVDPTVLNDPNYVKAKSILSDIDRFDAEFFGISPKEAERMDPQHRLFLEVAWEAIEQAGYNPETYAGAIGVYAGAEPSTYLLHHISPAFGGIPDLQTFLGNATDYLSSRVSYKLNLKGPSVTVQTACSTSLVAVHMACQSLLNGECDLALAGGISVTVPQKAGYVYQEGGIASPDGHCRSFDASAQGSFFGNGVGIVVLKRLSEAIADGDCIHAVIKGSAVNNDGALKAGYTAPSPTGQAAVITEAQAIAGIDPDTIMYIEAHGSGTSLGDPIEITALNQVFCRQTNRKAFCAIGSVKSNFGHLSIAAGVAGLIKTVLALKHQQIPPSLHFEQPNPEIDFANSPFYINTELRDWHTHEHPRRAGVSSFGMGGTNAHVILEEAPLQVFSKPSHPWQVLTLSAKTNSALEQATDHLVQHLQHHLDLNLADVAYTLHVGRQSFAHRQMVVCQDREDAICALRDPKRILTSVQETSHRPVAFIFTGVGTQYVNMGWELYQEEPTFREQVDRCCELLKPLLDIDLRNLLYPSRNSITNSDSSSTTQNSSQSSSQSRFDLRQMLGRSTTPTDAATQPLNQTHLTQPAVFVIEYALAQLWMSWGIRPVAMMGYSIGEYVAACLAGVLSLEDALTLVAKRAQIIEELPGGAMLAVPLSEAEARLLLNKNLALSAINGTNLCVIAGTIAAIDQLALHLTEKGLACRRLQTSHAFHSHLMQPIAAACTDIAKTLDLKAPQIPYVSNVTGTWITATEATDPSYWTQHLCQPVRFADGINALWQQHPVLLEIGPGQTLSSLAMQCLESNPETEKVVLSSLRDAYNQQSDRTFLLNILGQLWLSGVAIDWSQVYAHEPRHRVPLPTYPFERQRYWIDCPKTKPRVNSESLERKLDMTHWFHIPSWKRAVPLLEFEPETLMAQPQCWLVFIDACGVGLRVIEQLDRANQDIIVVRSGEGFDKFSEREYSINPENREDYDRLFQALHDLNQIPSQVIHLWNVTSNQEGLSKLESWEQTQTLGFYSLLFLSQTLSDQATTRFIHIDVISNGLQEVTDEDRLCPEKATLLGSFTVIPQEYDNITCRSIDITLPDSQEWHKPHGSILIERLMAELVAKPDHLCIAHRGNRRWLRCFEPLPVKDNVLRTPELRQGGVYVITGGLGGIGLAIAQHLAETVQAKLVLIGRSGLPPKSEWKQWISTRDEQNSIRTKIEQVQRLETLGAEALVIPADVTNLEQMQNAIQQGIDRFGTIHGVIHAAGVPGAGLMQLKTAELAAQVLAPKVKGTLVLEKILQNIPLDFWVLCSSLTAIYGGLGQVDYCAANAFLDAFAHDHAARHQRRTIAINWDWWQWDSWQDSLLSFAPEMQAMFKQMRQKYSITFTEGIKALGHILSHQHPQVIVSTRNLQAVIEQHETFALANFAEKPEQSRAIAMHPRPHLRTTYVAPRNAIERKLAELYQEFLAVEFVGIYDNFLDLGGHSLLATQVVSQLRQDFQIEVSLRSFLESACVAELALLIEEMLIAELEALSDADAEKLMLPSSS